MTDDAMLLVIIANIILHSCLLHQSLNHQDRSSLGVQNNLKGTQSLGTFVGEVSHNETSPSKA